MQEHTEYFCDEPSAHGGNRMMAADKRSSTKRTVPRPPVSPISFVEQWASQCRESRRWTNGGL